MLADPFAYAEWVVGAKEIRGADPGFPQKGTRFHHSVGVGPFVIKHHSRVLEVGGEPPARARCAPSRARQRDREPAAAALARGHAGRHDGAGRSGMPARVAHKAGNLVLRGRNFLSLDRLKALAEARA